MKRIIDAAEKLEWKAHHDSEGIEFSQYSPAGEDFSFYAHGKTARAIIHSVLEYSRDFDPDEHIAMWIEAKRNGVSGVPSTRELVHDAEEIEKMLEVLADALIDAVN